MFSRTFSFGFLLDVKQKKKKQTVYPKVQGDRKALVMP